MPPDALAYLKTQPEQAFTLSGFLAQAVKKGDSYQQLSGSFQLVDVPTLVVQAPLDPRVSIASTWQKNNKAAGSPMSPLESEFFGHEIGVIKTFSSATTVEAKLSQARSDMTFKSFSFSPFTEAAFKIGLKQQLWQNSFGSSIRKNLNRGFTESQLRHLQWDMNQEEWMQNMIELFYRSWLAQKKVEVFKQNLSRQKKLVQITSLKLKRGTAEEADLLQVKSAQIDSELNLQQTQSALETIWRELTFTLKIPRSWAAIDPSIIPMSLTSPFEFSGQLCAVKSVPMESLTVKKTLAEVKNYELQTEIARDHMRPDLSLLLSYENNGIDAIQNKAWSEMTRLNQPQYTVGLQLSFPLTHSAAEAEIRQGVAGLAIARAQHSEALTRQELDQLEACAQLSDQENAVEQRKKVFLQMKTRVELEQRRFELGRVGLTQVIQAGEAATLAENQAQQAQIHWRLAQWKLMRIQGQYKNILERIIHEKSH